MASVLRDEPDLTKVPAQARRLLKRCLEKDPQKRLRHIGDVMALLDEPPSGEYVGRPQRLPRCQRHADAEMVVASRRGRRPRSRGRRSCRLGAVAIATERRTGRALRGRRIRRDEVLLRRRDGRVPRRPLDGVPGHGRRRREPLLGALAGHRRSASASGTETRSSRRRGRRQPVRVLPLLSSSAAQEGGHSRRAASNVGRYQRTIEWRGVEHGWRHVLGSRQPGQPLFRVPAAGGTAVPITVAGEGRHRAQVAAVPAGRTPLPLSQASNDPNQIRRLCRFGGRRNRRSRA